MKSIYCGNCGAKLEEGASFCSQCGTKVEEDTELILNIHTPQKKRSGIYLRSAAIMILCGIIGVIVMCTRIEVPEAAWVVYEKNEELYYADLSDLKNIEILETTDNLFKNTEMESNLEIAESGTKFSDDGTKIFYPEKCRIDAEGNSFFDLYYRDLTAKDSEPQNWILKYPAIHLVHLEIF